ncbi:MAG: 1-deoxy-D-xylulose-5-phosphate synthase [Spirochaetales bacterium]|nr:1-deoxy-D-xylulose-5-phosphate synthase [Spirochaetales bacterium]
MPEPYPLLAGINSIDDLKRLPERVLPRLAEELRRYIIEVVSRTGGHLASNLGVVELTIALHRVFSSPRDKIIWDVGHQTYAHKILTGRKDGFRFLRQRNGMSGFPKRSESEHDVFETGHASTSISAALGILCAQELREVDGRVIAVIGDGSLTGGIALEALNCAGQLGKKLIIVLNDNTMSIDENVGALSVYLTRITATRPYRLFRKTVDGLVRRIPVVGRRILQWIYRLKGAAKAFFFRNHFFADLGFEYVGPLHGHDIHSLIRVLDNVAENFERPTVVHVSTVKGKGYTHAESAPSRFHGVGAFSVADGKPAGEARTNYTDVFGEALLDLAAGDRRIAAVTAAMAAGTGLEPFARAFPDRFFDVGIAEQHAVTFSAGLAAGGLKPVVAVYSTFIQRAVDQVIHDVALQKLPVVFALDRAGLVGRDGETHHGVFDVALFRGVPHLAVMAPASAGELRAMLAWALDSGAPAVVRYPRAACSFDHPACDLPLVPGRGGKIIDRGGEALIVAVGSLAAEAAAAAAVLEEEGILIDVYSPRFLRPVDEAYFLNVVAPYRRILFVEDGVKGGGIGEYLGCLMSEQGVESGGAAGITVFSAAGVPDRFVEQGSRRELLALCGLDAAGIANRVRKLVGEGRLTPQIKI